jgi:hypothetical protein
MHFKLLFSLFLFVPFLCACNGSDGGNSNQPLIDAYVETVTVNGQTIYNGGRITDLPIDEPLIIAITFSSEIDKEKLDTEKIYLFNTESGYEILNEGNEKQVIIQLKENLKSYSSYLFVVATGEHLGLNIVDEYKCSLLTGLDLTPKFPAISDEDLLTLVQKQTFKYFWDFGHPVSGMARERSASDDIVTTGGTGFGIMAMIVAAERGFITRNEALERIQIITTFLETKCTAYHGAYAHWINGAIGKTQPFSQFDNGGDLVETALLFQGLLTAREYFNLTNTAETKLRRDITGLWEKVEWNWYQKNGEEALYWHWSPDYEWKMNMKISGWNECFIVYVLAASSPTYPITGQVYDKTWTRNGAFVNGKSFYDHKLPLGPDSGGPLFWSQYSFLGLNPTRLKDKYTGYWEQNRNHSLINYSYCVANPKKYAGYSSSCWGLTASDGNKGYNAFSPTNDQGVIAPTAALSAMPYTPEESMQALHFFYYTFGDQLWKEYGFRDAFNLSERWVDDQYIAIDQGPIIVMIENYRTQLIWNLFMQNREIQSGLSKLEFTY